VRTKLWRGGLRYSGRPRLGQTHSGTQGGLESGCGVRAAGKARVAEEHSAAARVRRGSHPACTCPSYLMHVYVLVCCLCACVDAMLCYAIHVCMYGMYWYALMYKHIHDRLLHIVYQCCDGCMYAHVYKNTRT
jgi:hypothetical protein